MDANNSSLYSTGSTMDSNDTAGIVVLIVGMLVYFVIFALIIVTTWKLYRKANKPGWASIIPVYNYVVLLEIVGRPIWWIILSFIPLVNIYIAFVIALDLAKSFGKSTGFGVATFFLPFVTYPILAFSKNARYVGPVAEGLDSFGPASGHTVAPTQTTATGQPIAPTMNEALQQPAPPTPTGQPVPPITPPAPQPPETAGEPNQPRPPQF